LISASLLLEGQGLELLLLAEEEGYLGEVGEEGEEGCSAHLLPPQEEEAVCSVRLLLLQPLLFLGLAAVAAP
jgi:hypothetical protein